MATAKKTIPVPAASRAKRVAKPATATPPTTTPLPVTETLPPNLAAEEPKAKRIKMIRDGFTIPKGEYQVLEALKLRAGSLGTPSKKSELLRAGIKALVAMPDRELLAALRAVPAIKTGRPGKE